MGTLLDGNPANNFLTRAVTFNPNGILTGARRIVFAGHYAYVLTSRGLVVVDVDNPLEPKVTAEIDLDDPRGVAVQFRYAFVVDRAGLKVLDLTALDKPRVIDGAVAPLEDARNVYMARTYAYVSGGKQGLVIVDVERPEQPKIDQIFTADGQINDLRDVKLGMVNASAFAFLADGENGLRVVQLFSPEDNPNHYGFSPKADAVSDRDVSHARARAGGVRGHRSRSRGGRVGQSAGGVRPARRAAAQLRRTTASVRPQRTALYGDQRSAAAGARADVARNASSRSGGALGGSCWCGAGLQSCLPTPATIS